MARSLAGIIKGAKRRVAVTIFASNVARIKAVADAAKSAGRHLVVAGRAMHRIIEVAIETGYLPTNFKYHDQEHFSYLEPDEVVLLCTGSQGEPRAALARIAEDEHPDIELGKGDLVIFSSRTIPGNEREVGRIQNQLVDLGCEHHHRRRCAGARRPGHPRREELKEMYAWVRPRIAIPMHGEAAASRRARQACARGGRRRGAHDPQRRHGAAGARAGRRSSTRPPSGGCSATAACWCRPRTGRCASAARWRSPASSWSAWCARAAARCSPEPEIVLDGVPTRRRHRAGRCTTSCAMRSRARIAASRATAARTAEMVREAVRRAVRSAVEDAWGKRPIAKILLTQVPR